MFYYPRRRAGDSTNQTKRGLMCVIMSSEEKKSRRDIRRGNRKKRNSTRVFFFFFFLTSTQRRVEAFRFTQPADDQLLGTLTLKRRDGICESTSEAVNLIWRPSGCTDSRSERAFIQGAEVKVSFKHLRYCTERFACPPV